MGFSKHERKLFTINKLQFSHRFFKPNLWQKYLIAKAIDKVIKTNG